MKETNIAEENVELIGKRRIPYLVIAVGFLFGSIIPLYKAFSMWDIYSFPYLLFGLACLTVSKECFKELK